MKNIKNKNKYYKYKYKYLNLGGSHPPPPSSEPPLLPHSSSQQNNSIELIPYTNTLFYQYVDRTKTPTYSQKIILYFFELFYNIIKTNMNQSIIIFKFLYNYNKDIIKQPLIIPENIDKKLIKVILLNLITNITKLFKLFFDLFINNIINVNNFNNLMCNNKFTVILFSFPQPFQNEFQSLLLKHYTNKSRQKLLIAFLLLFICRIIFNDNIYEKIKEYIYNDEKDGINLFDKLIKKYDLENFDLNPEEQS